MHGVHSCHVTCFKCEFQHSIYTYVCIAVSLHSIFTVNVYQYLCAHILVITKASILCAYCSFICTNDCFYCQSSTIISNYSSSPIVMIILFTLLNQAQMHMKRENPNVYLCNGCGLVLPNRSFLRIYGC